MSDPGFLWSLSSDQVGRGGIRAWDTAAFHGLFDFDHQAVSSVFAPLQIENIRIACNLKRAGHVNSRGYLRDLTAEPCRQNRGSTYFLGCL
ncbi:hypothetical protein SM11_pC1588 (plasmid) [Sinorhizobium meliloti SM11]|uniref:Uncharacterized protein n=1 Tax=Sinorhizobium meliloti (strain SM11) TaxID=707241 RepID=F7XCF5_SINMM|nr:hypothetical protein SM11_pC1588 [Sinorhizobium meliloti SM11]